MNSEFLPKYKDIFVLPFYGKPIDIDFGDREQIKSVAETINKLNL